MNLIGNISGSPEPSRATGMLGHKDRVKFAHRISEGVSSFDMHLPVEEFDPGISYDYYFFFGKKGEKMYIGYSGDYLRSYTLSIPYDVSTAVYDNLQLNHSEVETSAECGTMSPDGKYLFIGGLNEDTITQFTLSTLYDITTAQPGVDAKILNNFHAIGSASDYYRFSFRFNGDGTKFYSVGYNQDRLEQFSLSTAYDITTYSSDGYLSLTTYGIDGSTNMIWNNNGTKFYILNSTGDDVNEFSVSIAYDVTSTVTELNEFYVGSQESTPEDIAFNSDGTKMFIAGSSGDEINVYDLSTGFDTSTASFDTNYNVGGSSVRSMVFSPDGTKLSVSDSGSDVIYYYTLSSAFDLSTLSTASTIDLSPPEMIVTSPSNALKSITISDIGSIRFNSDGTYMYAVDRNSSYDKIIQFRLMESYNPTKAALGYIDMDADGSNYPNSVEFNPDGTKIFILDGADDRIYTFSLDHPYILGPNICTLDSVSPSLSSVEDSPRGFAFAPGGTGFYLTGYSNDRIYYYDCQYNYNTYSIAARDGITVSDIETTPREVTVAFTDSGQFNLFLYGSSNGKIHSFNLLI